MPHWCSHASCALVRHVVGRRRTHHCAGADGKKHHGPKHARHPISPATTPTWSRRVMLDEFGPMKMEPGTLGMDIKAHPTPASRPPHIDFWQRTSHRQPANDTVYRNRPCSSARDGAIHEEVSSDEIRREGGTLHGFQIWLNTLLRRNFAIRQPSFTNAKKHPLWWAWEIKVMIGSLNGCTSPCSPLLLRSITTSRCPGGRLDLPVDPTHNAFAHIIEGQLEGEGRNVLRDEQLALRPRRRRHAFPRP